MMQQRPLTLCRRAGLFQSFGPTFEKALTVVVMSEQERRPALMYDALEVLQSCIVCTFEDVEGESFVGHFASRVQLSLFTPMNGKQK